MDGSRRMLENLNALLPDGEADLMFALPLQRLAGERINAPRFEIMKNLNWGSVCRYVPVNVVDTAQQFGESWCTLHHVGQSDHVHEEQQHVAPFVEGSEVVYTHAGWDNDCCSYSDCDSSGVEDDDGGIFINVVSRKRRQKEKEAVPLLQSQPDACFTNLDWAGGGGASKRQQVLGGFGINMDAV